MIVLQPTCFSFSYKVFESTQYYINNTYQHSIYNVSLDVQHGYILWAPIIPSETIKIVHEKSKNFRDVLEGTQALISWEIKKVMQRKLMLC